MSDAVQTIYDRNLSNGLPGSPSDANPEPPERSLISVRGDSFPPKPIDKHNLELELDPVDQITHGNSWPLGPK